MKKTVFFFSVVLSLALAGCSGTKGSTSLSKPTVKKQGIQFVKSDRLQPLLERAKAENKLVFLDFYTDWCLPCRIMDEEVFTQRITGENINRNFISYKVNAEKSNGSRLSTIFNVNAYPTLLFLDADGKVLVRKDGSLSNSQFLNLAEQAIAAAN